MLFEQPNIGDAIKEPSVIMEYLESLLPKALSTALEIIFALIILLVGAKLIKWIVKIVNRSLEKSKMEAGVAGFLCQIVKYLLYFVLIMLILSQFGVTAGSVVAVLGSAGLTIGLALQGSLSNFAGGVLILLLKPFMVGDYIIEKATGLEGTVKEITIFYTKLTTVDNREISIPNGNLSNTSIINVTKNGKRRVDVNVNVAYETDLKAAKEVLKQVAKDNELVLADEPIDVFVADLGDNGVKLELRVWTKTENYWTALWDLRESVKVQLDMAEITIPFAQIDVKIKQ